MEKYIYNQNNGLWYELQGDYYIPCLQAPEAPNIGIWGQRRRKYLKEHRGILYNSMLYSGILNAHLEDVDKTAKEMFDRLVKQMAQQQGITEVLKAKDQLAWIGAMNNIRNVAEEIINTGLIYT